MKFNVWWGYNNVQIKTGNEWKAAFATNHRLFEPQVMFFGMTNSPATFQGMMNTIFADLVTAGKVTVYLDDILIFTSNLEEHHCITCKVLKHLQEHDLYLQPEKCEFEKTEVEYLSLIILEGRIHMDPAKVKAVKEWAEPRNLCDVRTFLGFANFYCCFITGFAKIVCPLNDLTKKDVPWHWTFVERHAFQALKDVFISKPILAQWDPACPMCIETDASNHTTAGMISQLGDDSKWHPVAYQSESMIDAEQNYEIYDKELLVVIRALEEWQHFLEGLPEPFEIITDHTNLKYWTMAQDLTCCQARWALWLSRFNFHLTHKPSKSNVLADTLSHLPSSEVHDLDNNCGVTVLKPEYFRDIATAHLISTDSFKSLIQSHKDKDPEVLDALKGKAKELLNGELE
jgi:hypothetical protein